MTTFTTGTNSAVDFASLSLASLFSGTIISQCSTIIRVEVGSSGYITFSGSFVYDGAGNLVSGTLTGIMQVEGFTTLLSFTGFSMPVVDFLGYVGAGDNLGLLSGAAGAGNLTGDDLIRGSRFSDFLSGFADVVLENAAEGTDSVQSSVSFALGANVENLTLTGNGAINATGNILDNALIGNGAANTP